MHPSLKKENERSGVGTLVHKIKIKLNVRGLGLLHWGVHEVNK